MTQSPLSSQEPEPWKAAGMSRATWFRRGFHLPTGSKSVSPSAKNETPESQNSETESQKSHSQSQNETPRAEKSHQKSQNGETGAKKGETTAQSQSQSHKNPNDFASSTGGGLSGGIPAGSPAGSCQNHPNSKDDITRSEMARRLEAGQVFVPNWYRSGYPCLEAAMEAIEKAVNTSKAISHKGLPVAEEPHKP